LLQRAAAIGGLCALEGCSPPWCMSENLSTGQQHRLTPQQPLPPPQQVDDGIKYGMIEAISHLIHRDYDAIVLVGVTG
jgi:hypothetical protein